jgi:hypothetical protein
MIFLFLAPVVMVLSRFLLPGVAGEIAFMLHCLLSGLSLLLSKRSPFQIGLKSAGCGLLVIGCANIFWVWGGLLPNFPDTLNFWGSFLLTAAYPLFFYCLVHAAWNLGHSNFTSRLAFAGLSCTTITTCVTFIALVRGLSGELSESIAMMSLAYVFFSAALFTLCALLALHTKHPATATLLLAFLALFSADTLYLVLSEDYGSFVWNLCLVAASVAFVQARTLQARHPTSVAI